MTKMLNWQGDSWHAEGENCTYRIWSEDNGVVFRYVLAMKREGERRQRWGTYPTLESAQADAQRYDDRESERLSGKWRLSSLA